jgi:hypothetical protein
MLSIGIVSDSHHNINNLNKAVEFLVKEKQIDTLLHLGDFYDDVEKIDKKFLDNIKIYRVPGTQSEYYNYDKVPNKIIINFEKLRCLLTHVPRVHQNDKNDLLNIDELVKNKKIDVMFYGHSHQYRIMYENNVLYINPGHLKDIDVQGNPPTFAYVEIDGNKIYIKIYNLLFVSFFERKYTI